MANYEAPSKEIGFVLQRVLDYQRLNGLPAFSIRSIPDPNVCGCVANYKYIEKCDLQIFQLYSN